MDLVKDFAPHLPLLRRYARALTGSQESGDAYIRASLAALVEDPEQIERGGDARTALYRFFHVIWGTTGAQLETDAKAASSPADTRLQALAPIQRQAFLLTALEGFTVQQAAFILGVSEAEHADLVAAAHRDIEQDLKTKVLIIEDEPIIAADLESLVEDLGHEVIGNATTRSDDILAVMDVPIIFITAFPERLLTGERPEPTFLIPKPFQENTVKAAIGQALFFNPAEAPNVDA